ncbi:MAG: hypothetical protein P8Q37_07795 [Porticoccaceae bacterium]|nr:hypothetical protein [Porticoccaceae bacterium]
MSPQSDLLMPELIRSKKFKQMSDQQILRRLADHPKGEDKFFLDVEVDYRKLGVDSLYRAEQQRVTNRHSKWYYIFYALLFALFVGRFITGLG